jgi:hypothetical protein
MDKTLPFPTFIHQLHHHIKNRSTSGQQFHQNNNVNKRNKKRNLDSSYGEITPLFPG